MNSFPMLGPNFYTNTIFFKFMVNTQLALDVIKGQKTMEELASEYVVHVNQTSMCKKHLLDTAPALLALGNIKTPRRKR